MADLKSKQIKFPLTGTSVVSSSAQIATDISGSFVADSGSFSTRITADSGSFSTRITADSGSFSTRVTTAESELGNTLVSSSAQIATDISGSFVAPSASFSTRVTTAETELTNTLVSSSAQLSTDISGSFVAPSASFSTRVTTAETELGNTLISGSAQIATDISGSLSTAAIVGLGASIVSASAQLSTDISGSFIAPSASFSTRVTTAETELENTLISGSAQIATDISGSFVAPSASFSTRVTTAETELGNTLVSSSAQIADDISGSLSTAAVVGLGAGIISGSSSNSSLTTAIVGEGAGILSGSAQISADISGSLSTAAIVGLGANLVSASAQVDHDSTTNFVANEHIDHSSVSVIAGTGMTGGGTIAANRTLNVIGGTGVTANANDIAIGQDVATTANVQFNHISASGNISSSRGSLLGFDSGSFNINLGVGTTTPAESLEVVGAISASTSGSFLNIDAPDIKATRVHGTILTATQGTIDHDSLANFVADEHVAHGDVSIVAGAGLTGGGTIASNRTINVVGGTGVTANANDVAIGQDVADDADVTFASVTTTGNIVAQGDITAQNYIVSSSVTHMTSSIRSGSTVSGDTPADDTHQFTGSLSISGSATDITNTMTASLASIFLQNNGHFSSSLGTIKGFSAIDGTTITGTTFTGVSGSFSENLGVNTTTPAEALEVVGSVSASASGSFLNVDVTDNLGVTGVFTLPNIANVSASIASAVAGGDDLGNHTATQDLDMDGNDIFDVQHISGSGNISGSLGNILGYKSGSFQQLDANVVSASSVQATSLTGLVGTATQGTIDHDSLANFVANEHVDHSGVTITAGDGLTGGGTIAATRTLAVGAGTGVTVNANDVAIGQAVATTSNVKFNHISGSGNLSGSAGDILGYDSLSIISSGSFGTNLGVGTTTPAESLEVIGAVSASTSGSFLNVNAPHITATNIHGTIKTATQGTIDHDSLANFVADEHVAHGDVSVIAGTGLTGGGTIAANRTLNVIGGTGVTANANDVAIGQDVATTANVLFAAISASGDISGSQSGSFLNVNVTDNLHVSNDIKLIDNGNVLFGADNDMNITHNGTDSFIDNYKGHLNIRTHDTNKDIVFSSGSTAYLTIDSSATLTNFNKASRHLDSVISYFGTGLDGRIYHDGNNFYIAQVTTGDLYIQNELNDKDVILRSDDGSGGVTAYLTLDGSTKTLEAAVPTNFAATSSHASIKLNHAGHLSGSLGTITGIKQANITSGSFDYINATGLMTASGLETSGDIVAFGSSDRELKDDIKPIENPLEKMDKIGGYTFVWNDKQNVYKGKDIGVVAQEIQEIMPEIVATRANGYLGVKYEKIVPLLIESIKENTKQIKELKQEINEIKEKCDCLNK